MQETFILKTIGAIDFYRAEWFITELQKLQPAVHASLPAALELQRASILMPVCMHPLVVDFF